MAAKSISMQMKKFWYPADTVPDAVVFPAESTIDEMTPPFSSMASNTPTKNNKIKSTELEMEKKFRNEDQKINFTLQKKIWISIAAINGNR